ncbi:putative rRNA-processing protein EBP2 [Cinnamomum micranthum f. kanehirae]|uniref:Putative rRNA-processing protein EBP2 n=1 Tax=Cinnamomum micranthum f. kanehirae TaxID=337451 RepID=A0A443NHD7_9MAGN|nr:putative rRNA-processing protein EBP2 [Cinnamomum micranthum f. kanehirae]
MKFCDIIIFFKESQKFVSPWEIPLNLQLCELPLRIVPFLIARNLCLSFSENPYQVKITCSVFDEMLEKVVISLNSKFAGLKTTLLYSDVDAMKEDDMEGETTDEESESESDEELMQSEPSKNCVYSREGLLDKLGDISWPENLDWIHKLSIEYNREQEVDVNGDLAR